MVTKSSKRAISWLFLGLLLFVGASLSRGEPAVRQVDGLTVPPPDQMVDVSDYSDFYRKLARAGLDPGDKLIGLYYLVSEFEGVANGKIPLASRAARVAIILEYNNEQEAKDHFKQEMIGAEKQFASMRFSSAEVLKDIAAGQKDVDALLGTRKVNVSGMAVLEMDFSRSTKGGFTGLVNGSITTGGRRVEFTMVYCNGFQRVGNKVIHLTYSMPLKDSTTASKAKDALEAWMRAIEKRN